MEYLLPEETLKLNNKFQVFYFYSTWMNFHNRFSKLISSFEEKNNNYKFTAIDVDIHKQLCNTYQVKSIPTIIIMVDGKEIKRCHGMLLSTAFRSTLNDIYNKHKEKENVKRIK